MIGEIAKKIRDLRKENNFTLKDLSQKTGLSVSFLSQIENGSSSLALTSLKKIADAFNVSISYFFTPPETHNFLVKINEQKIFKMEGSNSEFIRISGNFPSRNLESMLVMIPPEQTHGSEFTHPGEEFVYVLEGGLIVILDDKEYFVEAGNCMQYPSTIPHLWKNPMKQTTKLISVTNPLIF